MRARRGSYAIDINFDYGIYDCGTFIRTQEFCAQKMHTHHSKTHIWHSKTASKLQTDSHSSLAHAIPLESCGQKKQISAPGTTIPIPLAPRNSVISRSRKVMRNWEQGATGKARLDTVHRGNNRVEQSRVEQSRREEKRREEKRREENRVENKIIEENKR